MNKEALIAYFKELCKELKNAKFLYETALKGFRYNAEQVVSKVLIAIDVCDNWAITVRIARKKFDIINNMALVFIGFFENEIPELNDIYEEAIK